MRIITTDDDGWWTEPNWVEDMIYPMRCTRCNRVHDAAKVEVLARHPDCSVWKCPNCRATIDDRPDGYGGAVRVSRQQ